MGPATQTLERQIYDAEQRVLPIKNVVLSLEEQVNTKITHIQNLYTSCCQNERSTINNLISGPNRVVNPLLYSRKIVSFFSEQSALTLLEIELISQKRNLKTLEDYAGKLRFENLPTISKIISYIASIFLPLTLVIDIIGLDFVFKCIDRESLTTNLFNFCFRPSAT